MKHSLHTEPLNSPFETGVRSLTILVATSPETYGLQRLVEMGCLAVHSDGVNGPVNPHAPLPVRAGELLVGHGLTEKGLLLIISRGSVQRVATKDGFRYQARGVAAPFMASLTAEYSCRLKRCVE